MKTTPTRIQRFNTASIGKLSPYRVVLNGQVLTLEAHLSASSQLLWAHQQAQGSTAEATEEQGDDGEVDDPERFDIPLTEESVASILLPENIECSLPAWRLAEQSLLSSQKSEGFQAGVLVPYERMFFLGRFLQVKGCSVSFVSAGTSSSSHLSGEGEPAALSSTAESSSTTTTKKKKGDRKKPWLADFSIERSLYIPCPPDLGPYALLAEFNACISDSYDYEKWYYSVKGVRVLSPPPFIVDEARAQCLLASLSSSSSSSVQRRSLDPLITAGFYPLSTEDVRALYRLNVRSKKGQVPLEGSDMQLFRTYCQVMDRYLRHFHFVTISQRASSEAASDAQQLGRTTAELLNKFDQQDVPAEDLINEWNANGVFMRLSSRSPKDFLLHLVVASKSGEDVVNRLVKSGRSKASLAEYLRSDDPSRAMHVIFMPWDTEMSGSCEFRCFVHNKRINAISQYDAYSVSPVLQNHRRALYFRDQIVDFHEQIKDRIPFPSYVMDVVIRAVNASASVSASQPSSATSSSASAVEAPTSSAASSSSEPPLESSADDSSPVEFFEVGLIEFNPFYGDVSSGAALFEWADDYSLLYHGLERTVIRIRVSKGRDWDPQNRPTVLDLM